MSIHVREEATQQEGKTLAEIDECCAWLKLKLQDGELHLVNDIRKDAKKRKFSRSDLSVARKILGVKTFHMFDENGATDNWFWYLEV